MPSAITHLNLRERIVLGCDSDLLAHFDELAANDCLPTLNDLLDQASIIRERYACQTAYDQSLDKIEQDEVPERTKFPEGSVWTPSNAPEPPAVSLDPDVDMPDPKDIPNDPKDTSDDEPAAEGASAVPEEASPESTADKDGPKIHKEPPGFNGDRVLSNAILFLMEFGWWVELNYAIPEGDVGRVLEILKVYVPTSPFNRINSDFISDFYLHIWWIIKSKLYGLYARPLRAPRVRVLS